MVESQVDLERRLMEESPQLAAWLPQHLQAMEAADAEAHRSRVAFATGRFEEYWQARADEAQARLDEIYGGEPEPTGEEGQEAAG